MIRLKGTITAQSPIAVSYMDMDAALPRTPHGEVLLYGGTFRGPLRKAAYKAVRAKLAVFRGVAERGVFSLEQAYMLAEGVDTTREIENESSDAIDPKGEHELRRLNPLLNLFGRWRLPSRLSVDGMRAPEDSVMIVGKGVRHDMFVREPEEIEFLSDEQAQRLVRQLTSERNTQIEIDGINEAIKRLKREIATTEDTHKRQQISEQIAEHQNQIKALKKQREGAEESTKHPLAGFEAIAPGTELSHRMTLISGGDIELGLLLHALCTLARTPYLGGHRGVGCGQFSADWSVEEWPVGELAPHEIGRVAFDDPGMDVQGARLKQAMDTFDNALGEFDFTVATLAQARKRMAAEVA